MQVIQHDPVGLLQRVPELQELAQENPRLIQEIERGRPHALYRALLWMRWFGRGRGGALPKLDTLIASRRLFVEPMQRGPWLATFNGIGGRIYGESERDPSDGTYLTTLFIVVLFVPIYPFTAYLVRPHEGRKWQFFARVPLSPALYLWQRGLAAVLAAVVLVGAGRAYTTSRYQQIHVANALPIAVKAQIGDQRMEIPPGSERPIRVRLGPMPVKITVEDKLLESGTIEASRNFDLEVWNVLGLGLVYSQRVEYRPEAASDSRHDDGSKPQVHCGENAITLRDVDYPLVDPPSSIKMSEHQSRVTKSHVGFKPELSCVQYLFAEHQPGRATDLVARAAEAAGFEKSQTISAAHLLLQFGSASRASAFAERALAAHPGAVEYERLFQDILIDEGRRDEVLQKYRRRWEEHRDQADEGYLYARLLPAREAEPILHDCLNRSPDNSYLLRMQAFQDELAGHPEQVLLTFDKLRRVAPPIAAEIFELELGALVATGNIKGARQRAFELAKAADPNARVQMMKTHALLSRFNPTTSLEDLLSGSGKKPEDQFDVARVRIEAGLPIELNEIDALEPGPARDALATELLLRTDPGQALANLMGGNEMTPHLLAPEAWGLLLGEAARSGSAPGPLTILSKSGPASEYIAKALADYVRDGNECPELENLGAVLRAAFHFSRARVAKTTDTERRALLATARREDALHGLVTLAIDTWR